MQGIEITIVKVGANSNSPLQIQQALTDTFIVIQSPVEV